MNTLRKIFSFLYLFAPLACSSSNTPSSGGPATDGGGPDASIGAGGNAGADGSMNVNVPPAWQKPASCGGIGDRCQSLACGSDSTCQLSNDTCVPKLEPDGGLGCPLVACTAEKPYCLAYRCMSFDQASCYCTGAAGQIETSCASGPRALVGACVAEGQSCAAGDKPCCGDLACVTASPTISTCQKPCTQSSECKTGCCADVTGTGHMICASQAACTTPCKKEGEACSDGTNVCCSNYCITSMNPEFNGCRAYCKKNEDCKSGCCRIASNGTDGFCTDARYCSCGAMHAKCGPMDPDCCTGSTCASLGAGLDAQAPSFECLQSCKLPADCPSKCCLLFANSTDGICAEASQCSGGL
jgi:hypothetical protein